MIHDAKVEVTCDARNCYSSQEIDLEYKYTSYSGRSGYYDCDESEIEKELKSLDWVIAGEHHFCCQDCYESLTGWNKALDK